MRPGIPRIRLLRGDKQAWSKLPADQLGSFSHPNMDFPACDIHLGGGVVVGESELEYIAGTLWYGKGYFALEAPRPIPPFKADETEPVIISECELLVVIMRGRIRGRPKGRNTIHIICTDDVNLPNWLSSWESKSGTAHRLLKALVDFLIANVIEVTP